MSTPAQLQLLDGIGNALEELLLAGTTTASQATQRSLAAAFEEASRARFLRLGSTLRLVLEELKRFDGAPERFSGARLAFFVDRAWLLARATARALADGDGAALERLNAAPPQLRCESLQVATLGVHRRHVPGAFSAFEFRLRVAAPARLADGRTLAVGTPLVYALVFPAAADAKVPPEAMLALPQKQGFRPSELLDRKLATISAAQLGGGPPLRVTLLPESRIEFGAAASDWHTLAACDPDTWRARIAAHRPDPLELAVEFADELLLPQWRLAGEFAPCEAPGRESELEAPLDALGCRFALRVDAAQPALAQQLAASSGSALYAGVHLEHGRQVLTPLALLGEAPEYLGIDPKKFDRAALVRALNVRG